MILSEHFTLSNGVAIPKLGLGTWRIDDNQVAQIVRDAAGLGYRHFDTAQAYGNERGVGEGIKTCGVARDDIFLTTKVDAGLKSFETAKASIDTSLQTLGLDHIDLMIIHSPQPWSEFREGEHFFEGNLEAWRALEDAHMEGKLRAIGVSNFEQVDLENILDHGAIKPMVNQILCHVSNTPFELIDFTQSKGILVEAYSPVAHGKILDNAELGALADRYGVSIPQLCIRYCLQLGLLPLPKTKTPTHLQSNAEVDFEISDADMSLMKNMERIKDYGDASAFPVYGGKLHRDGSLVARS
jgi:diketogulonate reductase-like aldo/keto reductase